MCEEERCKAVRRPAPPEAAGWGEPGCCASCGLHGQHGEAHQGVSVQTAETLHQCHRCACPKPAPHITPPVTAVSPFLMNFSPFAFLSKQT